MNTQNESIKLTGDDSEALQPWGIVHLGPSLVTEQPYDISVHLDLPRSPTNLYAGNFMIDLVLLSPTFQKTTYEAAAENGYPDKIMPVKEDIIFRSRRPAILTYNSRLVDFAKRVAGLPWYVLGWRREAEALEIPMAESLSFPRGWRTVPESILLELKHGEGNSNIQVYDAIIKIRARFGGLRWIMYNHRISSFFIFTTAFWIAEMTFAMISWLILGSWSKTPHASASTQEGVKKEESGNPAIKSEKDEDAFEIDDPDLSDTPRNFPTFSGQVPLRYIPKVKEPTDEDAIVDEANILPFGAEADDESEEPINVGGSFRGSVDSGIGTSLSEGGGLQRRRSRGGR